MSGGIFYHILFLLVAVFRFTKGDGLLVQEVPPTTAQQEDIVNTHNALRAQETSASNMQCITYDYNLQADAQSLANRCLWQHVVPDGQGQNLYMTSASIEPSMASVVEDWYSEKQYYTYDSSGGQCTPGQACGHYTQIVWATTTNVGCGVAQCSTIDGLSFGGYIVVCNYSPPGNWWGEPPYSIGASCSACPVGTSCNSGLCCPIDGAGGIQTATTTTAATQPPSASTTTTLTTVPNTPKPTTEESQATTAITYTTTVIPSTTRTPASVTEQLTTTTTTACSDSTKQQPVTLATTTPIPTTTAYTVQPSTLDPAILEALRKINGHYVRFGNGNGNARGQWSAPVGRGRPWLGNNGQPETAYGNGEGQGHVIVLPNYSPIRHRGRDGEQWSAVAIQLPGQDPIKNTREKMLPWQWHRPTKHATTAGFLAKLAFNDDEGNHEETWNKSPEDAEQNRRSSSEEQ